MNIRASSFLLLAFACASCATAPVSREQAPITRFFAVGEETAKAAIAAEAKERGYTLLSDGRFQRTLNKKRDPLFGMIVISDDPQLALRIKVEYRSNERGCLVIGTPILAGLLYFSTFTSEEKFEELYLGPGSKEHAEVIALIEAAAARAMFHQTQ